MSNMRNFHGLRRIKAMGKTARCSRTRSRSAQGVEHPAILPWLYSSVGYAAAPAAIAPREAELPARI
jgi:hypothetical protein